MRKVGYAEPMRGKPIFKRKPRSNSASINRWTGKPHENKREAARRLRQNERKEA